MKRKKKLLGLVSNLTLLSSHQRLTAYGKATVEGCLLKRITALKGSEAVQVQLEGDERWIGGRIQRRMRQAMDVYLEICS